MQVQECHSVSCQQDTHNSVYKLISYSQVLTLPLTPTHREKDRPTNTDTHTQTDTIHFNVRIQTSINTHSQGQTHTHTHPWTYTKKHTNKQYVQNTVTRDTWITIQTEVHCGQMDSHTHTNPQAQTHPNDHWIHIQWLINLGLGEEEIYDKSLISPIKCTHIASNTFTKSGIFHS